MFSLEGKVAIITGASSGIGASIAESFTTHGAQVVNFDQNPAPESQAFYVSVDVSNQSAVLDAVALVKQHYGRIDILVNNAGISLIGKLEDTDEAAYDRIFGINVKGVYNCMYAVVETMKNQKSGVILNVASAAASVGIPDRFAYSASKGAVRSMTYAVAKDYVNHNIRCNCISPGRVHTPFVDDYISKHYPGKEQEVFEQLSLTQPIGRMAGPEEIATLVLYLCSDEASFVTGTDYPIDGGFIKLNT